MKKQEKIGLRQYKILILLFTVGTTVLITPSGLAVTLKQDAWVAPILAIGPGLLLVLLYNDLSRMSQGLSFVELCDSVLGKWLGKAISIPFIIFSFLASAMVLHDVGRFITTVIMPDTPAYFINFLFVLLLIYAIGGGFDTFARMVELMFPFFLILFIFTIVCVSPQIDFRNVQPILQSGADRFMSASLSLISIAFMPLVVFLMVQPEDLKSPGSGPRAFLSAALSGAVINVVIVGVTVLVLGSNIAAIHEFPVYYLAQKISVGKFLERMEAAAAAMWLITTFVKMAVYFYAALLGIMQIAKLSSKRPVLIPLSILLVVVSIDIFPNSAYENKFNSTDWILLVFWIGVLAPLLVWLVSYIRRTIIK